MTLIAILAQTLKAVYGLSCCTSQRTSPHINFNKKGDCCLHPFILICADRITVGMVTAMDVNAIRAEYPILSRQVYGRPLIYLDNAATTQLPLPVWRAMEQYYTQSHSNIHRSAHFLSEAATAQLEEARQTVASFLGAGESREILFTSGATEGLNLLARSLEHTVLPGDHILVTVLEHHSNFLPWQELCKRTGAQLHIISITDPGELDREQLRQLLALPRVRLAAITAVSNVLGVCTPIQEIAREIHAAGAWLVVDGAQGLRHGRLDMRTLGCDAFAFSAHKMMGPTGVGVLYVKASMLDCLCPSVFGGGMVDQVEEIHSSYAPFPAGFEAGTPNIAGIIGLRAAMDYLTQLGLEKIAQREAALLSRLEAGLRAMPGVQVYGSPQLRVGALSFNLANIHPYDAAALLDRLGIALRSGHHCAQLLMRRLGVSGTLRVSPAFYNTEDEIDSFHTAVQKVLDVMGV